jgi:hypothetical protein
MEDLEGKLSTQSGPRTTAPMWARPLLTIGEWVVYTALWSFADWNGEGVFPSHQRIANRAMCDRGSVADAIKKFAALGLLLRFAREREDGSTKSNEYQLVEVCPAALAERVKELWVAHEEAQQKKAAARRKADKSRGGTPRTVPPTNSDIPEGGTADTVPPGTPGAVPMTYPGSTYPTNTPPPSTSVTYVAPAREVEGGRDLEKESNDKIGAFARTTARDRPNWSSKAVADNIRKAAENRDTLPLDAVLAAAARCYADPQTRGPGRLDEDGDWWRSEPARSERYPHCGQCPPNRWTEDDEGRPIPCPRCNEGKLAGKLRIKLGMSPLPGDEPEEPSYSDRLRDLMAGVAA